MGAATMWVAAYRSNDIGGMRTAYVEVSEQEKYPPAFHLAVSSGNAGKQE
jgi:hypothetical protein